MFFKPKPKKLDSKTRFQNPIFRKQLQNARSYKRTPIRLPAKNWEIVLSKIGLGTWKAKALFILALLILIYVIYIPNPLYVKQINITGFKTEDQDDLKNAVKTFLDSKPFWPQANLLLLSKTGLENYLINNHQQILKVASIKKTWSGRLNLELEPRTTKYLAEVRENKYIVSNDGKIVAETASTSPAGNLIIIKLSEESRPQVGDKIFDDKLLEVVSDYNRSLPQILNFPLAYFTLNNRNSSDLNVFTAAGVKIMFDVKLDTADSLKRLAILYSDLSDADKAKLFYVDMRLKSRGYACYKNTPCTRETIIVNTATTTATSTLETIK